MNLCPIISVQHSLTSTSPSSSDVYTLYFAPVLHNRNRLSSWISSISEPGLAWATPEVLDKAGGLGSDTADGGTADRVAAGAVADVVTVAGGPGGTADGVAAGAVADVVTVARFVGGSRSVNT